MQLETIKLSLALVSIDVCNMNIFTVSLLIARLEYEKKRDMDSRIKELESSLSAMEHNLKNIQNKEADIKAVAEKATEEIGKWKEEIKGMMVASFVSQNNYHCLKSSPVL